MGFAAIQLVDAWHYMSFLHAFTPCYSLYNEAKNNTLVPWAVLAGISSNAATKASGIRQVLLYHYNYYEITGSHVVCIL